MSKKIRIRFSKEGCMKFIGHLEVMHFFQQLIRRSDIPICYSSGMSPHQIMSFALPLSTGLESRGEYVDIETEEDVFIRSKDALKALNSNSVEGIEILSYKELPEGCENAMASVKAADYSIRIREGYEPEADIVKYFEEMMKKESIIVIKKTKKSEKETDIRPFIHEHRVREEGGRPCFELRLSCGSVDNTKPELVFKALYSMMGEELNEYALLIRREEMYTTADNDFVSLDMIGRVTE
ncbi:MAG: TIGR03936 family radical SAM-associated protein [Lachnospiraceae bacterium]|nr:TIGR03936 family radical SAM-associated protein [Lachnospiraceae bacterium]